MEIMTYVLAGIGLAVTTQFVGWVFGTLIANCIIKKEKEENDK